MLIIVIGVMGFAIDLFNTQTQEAEFSQAQNGVVSLAQSVDSILPSQGSGAYVTFNARSGGPDFFSGYDTMSLNVASTSYALQCSSGLLAVKSGSTVTACGLSTPTGEFAYRAGSLVSYSGAQWIRAGGYTGQPFLTTFDNTLIIQNNSAPLGFVYDSHVNGSTWVTMDYRRINVNVMGIFNISEGIALNPNQPSDLAGNPNWVNQFKQVEIIQINLVNVSGGTFAGSNSLVASALNKGALHYSVSIHDPNPTGKGTYQFTITFSLSKQQLLPGQPFTTPQASLTINVDDQYNGQPVDALINIVLSNVQISISGG